MLWDGALAQFPYFFLSYALSKPPHCGLPVEGRHPRQKYRGERGEWKRLGKEKRGAHLWKKRGEEEGEKEVAAARHMAFVLRGFSRLSNNLDSISLILHFLRIDCGLIHIEKCDWSCLCKMIEKNVLASVPNSWLRTPKSLGISWMIGMSYVLMRWLLVGSWMGVGYQKDHTIIRSWEILGPSPIIQRWERG